MPESLTLPALRAHGIDPVPAIVWEEPDVLRPGLDYKHGVTYVTVPARTYITKTIGRGKAAKEETELVPGLALITSNLDAVPYTKEEVEALGFEYPTLTIRDPHRRWSAASIQEFLSGRSIPPNPPDLFEGIKGIWGDYVDFAEPAYFDILPLFVMGTYVFRLFRALGYIHFTGTAQSGKSQNLSLLNALCFNAQWASSMSAASLYRQLGGSPGTFLIDEAEGFDGERGEELRRILNAGYIDGSTVKRTEKGPNDQFQVISFESFGPKAIASINPLDPVIGSRCLIVNMRPTLRKFLEVKPEADRWQNLRDRLYLWTMFHSQGIAATLKRWQDGMHEERAPKLIARQWQITQVYTVLADYIDSFDDGDRADRLIAFFNTYFEATQRQMDAIDRTRLVLKTLPRVLAEEDPVEGDWYRLKTIHAAVLDRLEADQAEYYRTRSLSKNLDTLGFKERRALKGGTQVRLDPNRVRGEFTQRRIEPYPEDAAWLLGEVEYTHHAPVPTLTDHAVQSMWDQLEEPE